MRLAPLFLFAILFKKVFLKLEPLSGNDSKLRHSITSCVLTIAKEFEFQDVVTVSLTNKDYINFSISAVVTDQLLLRALHEKLQWSLLVKKSNKSTHRTKFFKISDDYIIQIRNEIDFEETLQSLEQGKYWNPHAKFIVVTTTIFNNTRKVVEYVFKKFWNAKVLNAIIVLPLSGSSDDLNIYTWFPFRNGSCGDRFDKAYIINSCASGVLLKKQRLFPDKIPKNMNKCPVRVRTVIWPPYVIPPDNFDVNHRTNISLTKGIEIMLMNTIAQVANFEVVYSVSKTPQDWGIITRNRTATGMMKVVLNGDSNIGIGAVAALNLQYMFYDNSISYIWESVTWCVPYAMPVPKWKSLINIFHSVTWISIFLAYVLITLSTWGLSMQESDESTSYRTPVSCSQNMLSMLLGMTVKILPRTTKIRLLIMLWVVISMHLSAAFTSSLIRELTEPSFEKPFRNTKEMKEKGFTFGLVPPTTWFFNNWESLNRKYNLSTIPCDDVKECLDRTAYQKNFAVAIPRMYMTHVSNKYITGKGQQLLYWLKGNIISYPIEMVMTKGFPLLHRVDSLILRIKEAGFLSKWQFDFLKMPDNNTVSVVDDDNEIILTLQHLEGAFILLNLGLLISTVIFMIELTICFWTRNVTLKDK